MGKTRPVIGDPDPTEPRRPPLLLMSWRPSLSDFPGYITRFGHGFRVGHRPPGVGPPAGRNAVPGDVRGGPWRRAGPAASAGSLPVRSPGVTRPPGRRRRTAGAVAVHLGRPEPDGPAAVPGGVHPADRACVPATVEALDLADVGHRRFGGCAADGRRGVHPRHELEGAGHPEAGSAAGPPCHGSGRRRGQRRPATGDSTPVSRVARWDTLRSSSTSGLSGTSRSEQTGPRVRRRPSMT